MARRSERGFTLVEIAVVVPVMMIIIIGLFTLLTYLLRSGAGEQVGAQSMSDIHTALSTIESDVALSGSFLTSNEGNLPDPVRPDGWSYTGSSDTSRVLILRSYATTLNPQSGDRRPVFINTQGCTPEKLYFNTALTYDTIYFVSGDGTLYRRRLVDTGQSVCGSGWYQKQSCPSKASGTTGCQADDEAIATNVSTFTIDYYTASSNDVKLDVYNGGATLVPTADSVGVTIGITRRAYSQNLTSAQTLRASKLITGQSQ